MATLTLQPAPAEGEDVYITSYLAYGNFGSSPTLYLEKGVNRGTPYYLRSLVRFDVSSIPANAVVASAILTLYKDGIFTETYTAFAYRCTAAWTELGATWNKYDGVNAWPVNGTGGDWDDSIVVSASVGIGENLALDVKELVADAVANRSGELSLLLKTAENELERISFYSSDEAVEIDKRPKLQVEYILAGSRIYLGVGGMEDLDFSAPVAFVPEGTSEADIPVSLTPGRRYAVAARRVSAAGVEEHNTHVVTLLEVDGDGLLQSAPLPRPFDLSFERVDAETIRLGFSCDVPLGHVEPTEYRVYGDGGSGVMDYETPVAVLTDHIAGRREFVLELSIPALPLQLATRAWRDAQAGPISPILVVPASPPPVAPAILP